MADSSNNRIQKFGDRMSPTIVQVSPSNGATGVSGGINVTATFSEPMRATTINKSTFLLYEQGMTTPMAATVSYSATTKKVTLNTNLRLATTYKAVVTTEARDLAGNPLDQDPSVAGMKPKVWLLHNKDKA